MTKLEMYAVKKLMAEMFDEGVGYIVYNPVLIKNDIRKNDVLEQVINKAILDSGIKVTEENQNDEEGNKHS